MLLAAARRLRFALAITDLRALAVRLADELTAALARGVAGAAGAEALAARTELEFGEDLLHGQGIRRVDAEEANAVVGALFLTVCVVLARAGTGWP
jgi:hypothetical protein